MTRFHSTVESYQTIADAISLPKEVPTSEAIVVVTGDQGRIPAAIDLLKSRNSPWLIISGAGKRTTLTDLINTQVGAVQNIQSVWNKILIDQSTSTLENAKATQNIVKEKALTRLSLVPHDYHMWRASHLFRQIIPNVELIEFPVKSGSGFWENSWHL